MARPESLRILPKEVWSKLEKFAQELSIAFHQIGPRDSGPYELELLGERLGANEEIIPEFRKLIELCGASAIGEAFNAAFNRRCEALILDRVQKAHQCYAEAIDAGKPYEELGPEQAECQVWDVALEDFRGEGLTVYVGGIPWPCIKNGRIVEKNPLMPPKILLRKIQPEIKHVPRNPLDPGVRFQTEVRHYERRGGR